MQSTPYLPFQHHWKKLKFRIDECTNRSSTNVPENILANRTNDPTSRWTSSVSGMGLCGLWLKMKRGSTACMTSFGNFSQNRCNQVWQMLQN
jgi:hypothetical protein